MVEKNFDEWFVLKKCINNLSSEQLVHEGDVWYCSIGVNVGREQDGKHGFFERPILVVRKWTADVFLSVPLSSSMHIGNYFCNVILLGRTSCALLMQMRTIDTRRLQRRIGLISRSDLHLVKEQCAQIIKKEATSLFPRRSREHAHNNGELPNVNQS